MTKSNENDRPKTINIKEFHDLGFLQEANRQFFHPLGLALEIVIDYPKDTTKEELEKYPKAIDHPNAIYKLNAVWDYREDPEGNIYDLKNSNPERIELFRKRAKYVHNLRKSKEKVRQKLFGFEFSIEPIPEKN